MKHPLHCNQPPLISVKLFSKNCYKFKWFVQKNLFCSDNLMSLLLNTTRQYTSYFFSDKNTIGWFETYYIEWQISSISCDITFEVCKK